MTKLYVRSWITTQYMVILPVLIVISFIFMMLFFTTGYEAFRILSLVFAGIMLAVLASYIYRKSSIGKKVDKISDWKEYDDATVLGQAFFLDQRMLVFDKKLIEFKYDELTGAAVEKRGKKKFRITFTAAGRSASTVFSSQAQADRLARFLLNKNPSLQIAGVNPSGDGRREHIESGAAEQ